MLLPLIATSDVIGNFIWVKRHRRLFLVWKQAAFSSFPSLTHPLWLWMVLSPWCPFTSWRKHDWTWLVFCECLLLSPHRPPLWKWKWRYQTEWMEVKNEEWEEEKKLWGALKTKRIDSKNRIQERMREKFYNIPSAALSFCPSLRID